VGSPIPAVLAVEVSRCPVCNLEKTYPGFGQVVAAYDLSHLHEVSPEKLSAHFLRHVNR